MKKAIVYSVAALLFAGIVGFKSLTEKNLASVQKQNELMIFVKSEPINKYKILGEVKGGFVGSHEFDDLLEKMINKAKKEYPNANGIYFDTPIRQTHNTKAKVIIIEE